MMALYHSHNPCHGLSTAQPFQQSFSASCFVLHFIDEQFSLPLLHNHATALEIAHVAEHNALVLELLRRESGHQSPRPLSASGRSAVDEVVHIANVLRGVKTRLEAGAVAKADLEGDCGSALVDFVGWRSSATRDSGLLRRCGCRGCA
jgi:hypothetical protein